jgi:hypothetical protein
VVRVSGLAMLAAAAAAALAAGAATAAGAIAQTQPSWQLPPLVAAGGLGPGWRVVLLPRQAMPATRFTPEPVQGRAALRVEAERSYGNLVHALQPPRAAPAQLAWAWRLQQPGVAPVLAQKSGDDSPAKVCLSFDMPLAQVPFVERQLLRMARAQSGENLPTATLCWVWGGAEAAGSVVENPYTRRVRAIVLRNSTDATGTWLAERVNVAADFARAFGDESPALPPVTAVIVAGDADNTGGHSVAHIKGLRLEP